MSNLDIYKAASNFAKDYYEAKNAKGRNKKKFGKTYKKILKLMQNKTVESN